MVPSAGACPPESPHTPAMRCMVTRAVEEQEAPVGEITPRLSGAQRRIDVKPERRGSRKLESREVASTAFRNSGSVRWRPSRRRLPFAAARAVRWPCAAAAAKMKRFSFFNASRQDAVV